MTTKFELTKLDPQFKSNWVNALRSGKYIQGTGLLVNIPDEDSKLPITHCCLGVAGAICGISAEELETGEILNDLNKSSFPEHLVDFWNNCNLQSHLASMNDGEILVKDRDMLVPTSRPIFKKYSFLEIADWIEKNL